MKGRGRLTTAVLSAAFLLGGAANALALPWVVSPYSPGFGTIVFSNTDIVGVSDIGDPEGLGTQTQGIYGAGFVLAPGAGYTVSFDADLNTWDSYVAGNGINDGKGYYDVFAVNINQDDYYWNLVSGGAGLVVDPIVSPDPAPTPVVDYAGALPGATWAWGGQMWGDGVLDHLSPLTTYTLTLLGDPTKPYYVSLVLDTASSPHNDTNYSSYGSYHVTTAAVPEPSTLLLMGSGMIGAGMWFRMRRK